MTKTLLGCLKIPCESRMDDRGSFQELYKKSSLPFDFKQINLSRSKKNVVRGMHFQVEKSQGKFIHVLDGAVVDVVLDIYKNSPTYGQHEIFFLNSISHALYVPPGLAHGFWVISDSAIFHYMCTEEYSPQHDKGVNPLDPELRLPWQYKASELVISEKDKNLPYLKDLKG